MSRFHLASLTFLVFLAAHPVIAATYYVGKCEVGAFATISDAVAAVPPDSTIEVCPGTYAEQVVISKALTLNGMMNGSSGAIITFPSSGLNATSASLFGTLAPQVLVTAGPVNISNLTIDGKTFTNCPSAGVFGIFYASSSGTVSGVEIRNQSYCLNGYAGGIIAESGEGPVQSVTIESGYFHDPKAIVGIMACSDPTPSTLNVNITRNYIVGPKWGIETSCNTTGSITANSIFGSRFGIGIGSPISVVSDNTVNPVQGGISVYDATGLVSHNTVSNASLWGLLVQINGANVVSNRVVNSNTGIYIITSGAKIKYNVITDSVVGIEFNCYTDTIVGNTINRSTTGLDQVPVPFVGKNMVYNTKTVRTGC